MRHPAPLATCPRPPSSSRTKPGPRSAQLLQASAPADSTSPRQRRRPEYPSCSERAPISKHRPPHQRTSYFRRWAFHLRFRLLRTHSRVPVRAAPRGRPEGGRAPRLRASLASTSPQRASAGRGRGRGLHPGGRGGAAARPHTDPPEAVGLGPTARQGGRRGAAKQAGGGGGAAARAAVGAGLRNAPRTPTPRPEAAREAASASGGDTARRGPQAGGPAGRGRAELPGRPPQATAAPPRPGPRGRARRRRPGSPPAPRTCRGSGQGGGRAGAQRVGRQVRPPGAAAASTQRTRGSAAMKTFLPRDNSRGAHPHPRRPHPRPPRPALSPAAARPPGRPPARAGRRGRDPGAAPASPSGSAPRPGRAPSTRPRAPRPRQARGRPDPRRPRAPLEEGYTGGGHALQIPVCSAMGRILWMKAKGSGELLPAGLEDRALGRRQEHPSGPGPPGRHERPGRGPPSSRRRGRLGGRPQPPPTPRPSSSSSSNSESGCSDSDSDSDSDTDRRRRATPATPCLAPARKESPPHPHPHPARAERPPPGTDRGLTVQPSWPPLTVDCVPRVPSLPREVTGLGEEAGLTSGPSVPPAAWRGSALVEIADIWPDPWGRGSSGPGAAFQVEGSART